MEGRHCGWREELGEAERPVWAYRGVYSRRCPRSIITGTSLSCLEAYAAWRLLGGGCSIWDLPAKLVDAFLVLELELRKEVESGSR